MSLGLSKVWGGGGGGKRDCNCQCVKTRRGGYSSHVLLSALTLHLLFNMCDTEMLI